MSSKKEGNMPCINLPCPPFPIPPGSQDSEVSEEQKREKILELKKKEKLLQEKLLKKVEELKKICLREAVSVFCFFGTCHIVFDSPASVS